MLFAAFAHADFSGDCNADVLRDIQQAETRKMSIAQLEEIKGAGARLCLEKSLNEIDKEFHFKQSISINKRASLDHAYCGSNPEAAGRGAQCELAKSERAAQLQDHAEREAKIAGIEKRIKRMSKDYAALLQSRPQPNRQSDPVADRKRVATKAIAKVKHEILESLKDPDSAKFRRITVSSDGSMVCGEVNSKNAMGGYVGFKKFVNIEDKGNDFYFYEEAGDAKMADTCEAQAGK